MLRTRRAASFLLLLFLWALPLQAQTHKELGRMWTFENPPVKFFKEAYGFRPSKRWLDHVRLSALRYGNGCSASFVSPRGLIMTNNHCARGNVAAVTPAGQDWLTNGFFARSLKQEVKIPGLTVQQLVAMEDVTKRMNAGLSSAKDETARRARAAANRQGILKAARKLHPDLKPEIVNLYQGGQFQLYSYKIYDDLRLVAYPNLQSAKFGGDPDNFTYPRFALDFAFVRAWEGGKPADTSKTYFKWSQEGPQESELVFVVGNPGSTGRLKTVAQVEFMRDAYYPAVLKQVQGMLASVKERMQKDPKAAKRLRTRELSLENTRKAFQGYLDGLRKKKVMDIKRKAEAEIRKRVQENKQLSALYGDAWQKLSEISRQKRDIVQHKAKGNYRQLQKEEATYEKQVGEAFFAVYGTSIPPDATFTLRLSDGVVKGFPMNGTIAPWFTTLYSFWGRYTEFGGKPPFDVPAIWLKRRKRLDLSTPFNLVSTCDIIGGNSGSPMINKRQEIVGLVFDGNIESLSNNYVFMDDVPRTVCVHPAIIIEALRKIYDSSKLADEIQGRGKGYR